MDPPLVSAPWSHRTGHLQAAPPMHPSTHTGHVWVSQGLCQKRCSRLLGADRGQLLDLSQGPHERAAFVLLEMPGLSQLSRNF